MDEKQNKIINLQGTAKMKVNVTAHGRQAAPNSGYRTTYGEPMKYHLKQTAANCKTTDVQPIRRIQWLPKDTLKPEYKTRTARAIAAIRRTANNVWERLLTFVDAG